MYDIVVIGAGPAGSTFARLVGKSYRVLLLDKRKMNEEESTERKVCCGGLLAPDAQKMLAHLGLGLPNSVICGPQMFSVRSIDFDSGLTRHYQRHYINVHREKFDRWLVSMVGSDTDMVFGALYHKVKRVADRFAVSYSVNGEKRSVEAKYVVGADGAASRVRDQVFRGHKMPEKYISIQHEFDTEGVMPYYVSLFDKKVTDFYSWIIQKEGRILIGTGIKKDAYDPSKFEKLVEDSIAQGFRVGTLKKKTGTLIMRTRKLSQINLHKNGVFLIGEAAGLISPSSAEGISYALSSGQSLAKAFLAERKRTNNTSHHDLMSVERIAGNYLKRTYGLKLNLLIKNVKVWIMYQPFLRKIVMISGVLSMNLDEKVVTK